MRVIVTRAHGQDEPLASALRRRGHDVVSVPLIEIERIDDGSIDVDGYDWIIVTSANGAAELATRSRGRLPRVAAIGEATATVLRAHGIEPSFVPRVSTQEGLVEEFPRPVGRALFVGAAGARRVIVEGLGAEFRAAYRTRELRPAHLPAGDVVVLASPSAARAFASLGAAIPVVTIGPQTTTAARGASLTVVAEARRADVEALAAAVDEAAG
jgi:uroporphyrinogen-III synthase